jgi:hypothetical protein
MHHDIPDADILELIAKVAPELRSRAILRDNRIMASAAHVEPADPERVKRILIRAGIGVHPAKKQKHTIQVTRSRGLARRLLPYAAAILVTLFAVEGWRIFSTAGVTRLLARMSGSRSSGDSKKVSDPAFEHQENKIEQPEKTHVVQRPSEYPPPVKAPSADRTDGASTLTTNTHPAPKVRDDRGHNDSRASSEPSIGGPALAKLDPPEIQMPDPSDLQSYVGPEPAHAVEPVHPPNSNGSAGGAALERPDSLRTSPTVGRDRERDFAVAMESWDTDQVPVEERVFITHRESMRPTYCTARVDSSTSRSASPTVLFGRVERSSGEPLSEIQVFVVGSANRLRKGVTDAFGKFAIRIDDGHWTVKVQSPTGRIDSVRTITATNGTVRDDEQGQEIRDLVISY